MLSQATALEYLTLYRSAYSAVFEDGKTTPVSATLHAPENRFAADRAALALIDAYRPMATSQWKRYASTVDEDTFESILYEVVLVRGGLTYDTTAGKKVTSWLTSLLRQRLIDELRSLTQSRDPEDAYLVTTSSPLSEDDDRSTFDAEASSFMSSTSATPEDDIEGALPGILDEVRERAASHDDLDADLIAKVTARYLLSRYGRVVGDEKLVTRADISEECDLSTHATRKATDAAEDILRRVLTNQPEPDRKTA